MKHKIKTALDFLRYPSKYFSKIEKYSLDKLVGIYLGLLILSGILAGIFNFLIMLIKSLYFNIVTEATVDFWFMLNYSLGISTSIMFIYLFLGTAGVMALSFALTIVVRKPYVFIVKLLLFSLMPVLVFGWIFSSAPYLLIWSVFLIFQGLK